jgi:hypothetical protein
MFRANWHFMFRADTPEHEYIGEADTPEDAACKLAIMLSEQGVLKK